MWIPSPDTPFLSASKESLELADIRYRKGLVTYLDVLDAQQTLLASELEMVQTDRARLTDMVTLFKAVGGGVGHAHGL